MNESTEKISSMVVAIAAYAEGSDRPFQQIADAVSLLAGSPDWTAAEVEEVRTRAMTLVLRSRVKLGPRQRSENQGEGGSNT